jgi:hypothetical protein
MRFFNFNLAIAGLWLFGVVLFVSEKRVGWAVFYAFLFCYRMLRYRIEIKEVK